MSKKKTHEEYVEELAIKNPNVEVVDTYIDRKTPILHRCKIDGYEWQARPSNMLNGKGCPKCAGNLKKTHEDYINELYQINPNIEAIELYSGAQTKILHRCLIDGHIWSVAPNVVLHGYGCPECKNKLLSSLFMKTHDEYVNQVQSINQYIDVLGIYKGSDIPILHKCKIDDYEWFTRPQNVLNGTGCPKCAGNMQRTHDEYVALVANINKNIEVVGDYINCDTPIWHRCVIDGRMWIARPVDILKGKGCPQCSQSHGEKTILNWLTDHHIIFIPQKKFSDCRDKNELPFDFYLPDYNVCIEYDGEQHFRPVDFAGKGETWATTNFEKIKRHDTIKTQYCENHNIHLLRIPYFKNVEEELNNFYSLNTVTSMAI